MKLSFDELKNGGGVCSHYAEFYKYLAERLGYNASTQIVSYSNSNINKSYNHQFVTISNEEGYCVIDQIDLLGCVYLKYS
jgi:hypothetical protein